MLCQPQHKGDIENLSHGLLFLDACTVLLYSAVQCLLGQEVPPLRQIQGLSPMQGQLEPAAHLASWTGLVVLVS